MRVPDWVQTLAKVRRAWREMREDARPRQAAIRGLKNEPEVWAELRRLAGKQSDHLVHSLLMGTWWFFIVTCTYKGIHDPRGIIKVLRTSHAFTPDQHTQLDATASQIDALLDDLELGSAAWSDDVTLLGYALMHDEAKFSEYANQRGLDPAHVIARLDALPHLDEFGRQLVQLTASRLPGEVST